MTLISDILKAISDYSKSDRAEFIKTLQEAQQTADVSKKRKHLAEEQKRAGELERLIYKIYEHNASGKLPDAQYAKEQDALSSEIDWLKKAINGFVQSRKSAEKFIALVEKYQNFDTMTTTMLKEFGLTATHHPGQPLPARTGRGNSTPPRLVESVNIL